MLPLIKKIEYALFPCQKKLDTIVKINKDRADEAVELIREYANSQKKKV